MKAKIKLNVSYLNLPLLLYAVEVISAELLALDSDAGADSSSGLLYSCSNLVGSCGTVEAISSAKGSSRIRVAGGADTASFPSLSFCK